jgi:hypothetical protein
MASPNARRPDAALTASRPPNDLRAGIAAAHKTGRTKRQAAQRWRDEFASAFMPMTAARLIIEHAVSADMADG